MLAVNSVKAHKVLLMATLGAATSYCAKITTDNSKDDISVFDFEFNKFKSLVDIRQEWKRRINPENDVFRKMNKRNNL